MPEPVPQSLFAHIVAFSRELHEAGVPVSSANLIDLCEGLRYIDIGNRDEFYAAASATLVSNQRDLDIFDQMFLQYWQRLQQLRIRRQSGEDDNADNRQTTTQIRVHPEEEQDEGGESKKKKSELAYSAGEDLSKKDLGELSQRDIERAREQIRELVELIASHKSRRYSIDRRRRRIDFRRTLRRNALLDQAGIQLLYRNRRIKKHKLVLLCDVSGSMERYSRFLIQFMYALRAEIPDFEVAVFSTRMTVITHELKTKSVEASLQQVADSVHDWAGGTNIGASMRAFNEHYAREMLRSKAVVVVLSDGWDRGDAGLMRDQMEQVHRRAHKLLWLNPLLGHPDYQPLTRGMQTALPFVDYFLPAHNLESLAQLAKVLRTIWR